MITDSTFNNLKADFGKVSSWLIWKEQGETVKSNIGDLSIFEDIDITKHLQANYVFLGLNASVHDIPNPDDRDWGAFHSSDNKRQNDYKLRYTFKDTRFWGSYISDVLKGCPEKNSNTIMKYYKNNTDFQKQQKELLIRELKILNSEPVLIAFGNYAYSIIKTIEDDLVGIKGIIKIPHYSCFISKENYKNKVLRILDQI